MEEPQTQEQQVEQPVSNFWLANDELRPFWKLSAYLTVALILSVFIYVIGGSVGRYLDWRLFNPAVLLLAAVLATVFLVRSAERRGVLEMMGLRWSLRGGMSLLAGIAIAAVMQFLLLLLELLLGGARIGLGHITFAYAVRILFEGLLAFTLVGFAEEILMRGYPFAMLLRQSGRASALIITSVIFSLMHAANPGFSWLGMANIVLAGIWLGVARLASGSLWLPVGLHIGWNFFLGSVFGFAVSGIDEQSIFITTVHGAEILTGGYFGPEGGLLATAVLILGTVLYLHPAVKRLLECETDEIMEASETETESEVPS